MSNPRPSPPSRAGLCGTSTRATAWLNSAKAEIDVTTLITGDPQPDEHLRSPDFFNVINHPTIRFESRRIAGTREHFTVTGELIIRGQTREVTLDVTFNGTATNPMGQPVAGFTATTELNRKDVGLNWNMALEAGGFLVGDQARIELELEAVRQDPVVAARQTAEDANGNR